MKRKKETQVEEPGGGHKRERVVYICNLSEDVWPFIETMGDDQVKAMEIEENANLADRDLLSVVDETDLVFISPKRMEDDFLNYYKKLFGVRKLEVLVPKVHTGKVCEDAMTDELVMKRLVEIANSVKRLTLKSYSTTEQFLRLVEKLKERGLTVYTPEAPSLESAWTVNFLGSKSGIRQLAQQSGVEEPDFKMATGMICAGVYDAASIAAHKYVTEGGVVIKTNKGHAGAGVLIFREGDLPKDFEKCEKKVKMILEKDEYWSLFPIVVESLIKVNYGLGGGFPNTEFKINKNGKIELLYFGGMRVTKEGVFKGMELNEEVISDRIEARMIDTGFYIGEKYAALGYRGYFDIDFISGKNNEIYVTESNVRRTGGTHVFQTAMKLIGKDFLMNSFIYSNNGYDLDGSKKYDFGRLIKRLESVLFDKKKKEGVVIASANLLRQNKLAYIVFGKTKKRAEEIEKRMENLLK